LARCWFCYALQSDHYTCRVVNVPRNNKLVYNSNSVATKGTAFSLVVLVTKIELIHISSLNGTISPFLVNENK